MSNTISSINTGAAQRPDLLAKVPKNNARVTNEFVDSLAKTRDAKAAAAPATDVQTSLIARDPVDADVRDDLRITNQDAADVVAVKPTTNAETAPAAALPVKNEGIWNWIGNNISSITMERRTMTAVFNGGPNPTTGTTPTPTAGVSHLPNFKDFMAWFFGDMSPMPPTQPAPQPAPAPAPAPAPTPTNGTGAPGFVLKWDSGKVDARFDTPKPDAVALDTNKPGQPEPLPAIYVQPPASTEFGWQDWLSMAFGGPSGSSSSTNSLTLQLEMRKFTAIFNRGQEASQPRENRSVIA